MIPRANGRTRQSRELLMLSAAPLFAAEGVAVTSLNVVLATDDREERLAVALVVMED
jgi:hypothetical protein